MNNLRVKLRMAYRRWRCDHFDHPFRQVHETYNLAQPLGREYQCNYCARLFYMPPVHPNCRCALILPKEDEA